MLLTDIIRGEMGTRVAETDSCGPGCSKDRMAPSISRQFSKEYLRRMAGKQWARATSATLERTATHSGFYNSLVQNFLLYSKWCRVIAAARGRRHPTYHHLLCAGRGLFDTVLLFCDGFDLDALGVAPIAPGLIMLLIWEQARRRIPRRSFLQTLVDE
jgi:hypothetical protein